MILPDPSGRFVLSAEMGTDQIAVWKLDTQKGVLVPNDPPAASLPPGDGPRHFAFHPNGRWLYSLQEEGSNIAMFDFDSKTGSLASKQMISSLPPGFAGTNMASEILATGDGKFVYAANRLHDSIACFAVGKEGRLSFVADEPTRGDFPRTFNFDPTESLVYSCNQRGDNITVFRRDKATGRLTFSGQYTGVGSPAIIMFLDLQKEQ